jgi:hypothetical protein
MVEHCRDYPWSSYPALAGYTGLPEWLETRWLLSLIGKDKAKAQKRYRVFVESVQNREIENPSSDIVGGVVLGNADFVTWIKQEILNPESDVKERPQLRCLKPGRTPGDVISIVCKEFGSGPEAILRKGIKRNLARDVSIYLSREMTSESGVVLGRYFGGISGAGIAVRHSHIAKQIETDRKLKRRVNRIRNRIINN